MTVGRPPGHTERASVTIWNMRYAMSLPFSHTHPLGCRQLANDRLILPIALFISNDHIFQVSATVRCKIIIFQIPHRATDTTDLIETAACAQTIRAAKRFGRSYGHAVILYAPGLAKPSGLFLALASWNEIDSGTIILIK